MSTREIAQSICSAVRCDKAGVRSEEIRLHTKPAPIMIMHITAAFHIASRFISPEAPLTTISISLTIFCIQPGARTLNTAPAPQLRHKDNDFDSTKTLSCLHFECFQCKFNLQFFKKPENLSLFCHSGSDILQSQSRETNKNKSQDRKKLKVSEICPYSVTVGMIQYRQ